MMATTAAMTTGRPGRLEGMRAADLDDLFRRATVAEIPSGVGRGTALAATGTWLATPLARLFGLAWRGKRFDPERGELDNLLTPRGFRAITAAVYEDVSWLDGQRCIALDYSRTSLVARWVRDEIREVAPGEFLGIVFLRRRRLPLRFRLRFDA